MINDCITACFDHINESSQQKKQDPVAEVMKYRSDGFKCSRVVELDVFQDHGNEKGSIHNATHSQTGLLPTKCLFFNLFMNLIDRPTCTWISFRLWVFLFTLVIFMGLISWGLNWYCSKTGSLNQIVLFRIDGSEVKSEEFQQKFGSRGKTCCLGHKKYA